MQVYHGSYCHISLQALRRMHELHTDEIDTHITAALVASGMDERAALDAYFESDTYRQLIDANAELHLKPWEEVLAVLEKELKTSKKFS